MSDAKYPIPTYLPAVSNPDIIFILYITTIPKSSCVHTDYILMYRACTYKYMTPMTRLYTGIYRKQQKASI